VPSVTDLRHLFAFPAAYAPSDAPSSPGGDEAPPSPAGPSGGAAGEGGKPGALQDDDEGADDAEHIKNPDAKRLSEEAKTWRLRFREAEGRIKDLEGSKDVERLTGENRTLRLRLAFERCGTGLRDLDAAWKLAQDDLAAVEVKDDGTVDTGRVAEIVGYVLDRYPYLAEVTEAEEPDVPAGEEFGPSGRPTNGRKRGQVATDLTALQRKFPALRGR